MTTCCFKAIFQHRAHAILGGRGVNNGNTYVEFRNESEVLRGGISTELTVT